MMLKITLWAVLALVALVLGYAAMQPNSFRVERTISIKAPAEKIFPLLNDFRRWEAWSPWEKVDPALKRSYSGAASGVGAVYAWEGNKDIGHGRMEITESSAPNKLVLHLHFIKPFEAHNNVDFVLKPQGDTTQLTQAMYGPSTYMSKLMSLFFSMDKMVGSKYEEGLAAIKVLAEK
jgi:hypothetical protein